MKPVSWMVLLFALAGPSGASPARVGAELMSVVPLNLETPLEVRQDGFPSLQFGARYRTRPFEIPFTWALRLVYQRGEAEWGLELQHHKLILDEPPEFVQSFAITHGFNFITVQRAWPTGADDVRVRAGVGAILAHPENVVRDRRLNERRGLWDSGYSIVGPAFTAAVSRRFHPSGPLGLIAEARASVAPVTVAIAGGEASLTHVTFQLFVGLGAFVAR